MDSSSEHKNAALGGVGAAGSASTALWGGALGAVLVGWSILMVLAPELGSIAGVLGSPVLAFFVVLRLLTPDVPTMTVRRGATLADLRERALTASGGRCADCGRESELRLCAALPGKGGSRSIERRFVALCPRCDAARAHAYDRLSTTAER